MVRAGRLHLVRREASDGHDASGCRMTDGPITADVLMGMLREAPGWAEYEARCQARREALYRKMTLDQTLGEKELDYLRGAMAAFDYCLRAPEALAEPKPQQRRRAA